MIIIVMGVTGAGKTTVGSALAASIGWRFIDGDTLHPPANVERMRAGISLTDADREPWLASLHALIVQAAGRRESLVLACSALKERYRVAVAGDGRGIRFVYLKVPERVAVGRAAHRAGHFASPAIVPGQFAALEEPSAADALILDATGSPEHLVAEICKEFGI
jgi:gluconokinase